MTKTKSIVRSSAVITLVLIFSKIMGFVRELLIASQLGANRESDIFKTATKMPQFFYSCIAAALVVTFIPVFSGIKNDKEKANEFFNNILNIVFIICIVLSIIGIIISPQLTKLFASGFEGKDLIITAKMTRIVMPAIIFLALSGLYTGYLQSYSIFLQPALTGVSADIVIIVGVLVFYAKYGIIAAVVAFLLSSIAQMAIQRPFLQNYKYKFYINFKDKNVRKMLVLAIPIIISTAVGQINVIVDSTFASRLAPGSISIVDYAGRLSSIINQVFIVSITTVLYPMLTEKYAENDMEAFEKLFLKSINIVVVVVIPLIFGMIVLSTPIVKLLLEHGKFDSNATLSTSLCLKFLAFSALGYSLMDILGKIFFSIKDTVTPMINGFIMIALNIILIVLLVPRFRVSGLALATTTSVTLISLIMIVELKYKLKDIKFKGVFKVLIKALVSGGIMAVIVAIVFSWTNKFLPGNSIFYLALKLVIPTLFGIVSYASILSFFKVDEMSDIINLRKRKSN